MTMKARVKSTGEIVDVKLVVKQFNEYFKETKYGDVYRRSELDFNLSAPEKTTRKWWVARDKDGDLHLYTKKPMKGVDEYFGDYMHRLPEESLPSVTFEKSPKRVRIEITLIDDEE